MIRNKDIDKIVKLIVISVNPDKIMLFGSYAYGLSTEDSDFDLLIIKDMIKERHNRGRKVRKHLRHIKIPVDILVHTINYV